MNKLHIVVFDIETTGTQPDHHEILEFAAQVYEPRSLEPIPEHSGGLFYARMKPLYPERTDAGALLVNKLNLDDFAEEKHPKVVWPEFVRWLKRFNPSGKEISAPICAGKNVRNFDLKFCDHYNLLYGPKKSETVLFNRRTQYDLEDQLFAWHENDPTMKSYKFDFVRDYYGISQEGAHSAKVDVAQEGELLINFLRLYRQLFPKVKLSKIFRKEGAA